jgi:hypothetical protein
MLLRILYFSTANADLTETDVNALVAHSVKANAARDVTGALAFNSRNFCQLLEGEEQTVRALVGLIQTDKRHSGFKVIDEKYAEGRAFPHWSMERVRDLDFSVVINAMNA